MSLHADCPACISGDHDRHDTEWGVTPGLIGGSICACSGDCAERARMRSERMAALFALCGTGEGRARVLAEVVAMAGGVR